MFYGSEQSFSSMRSQDEYVINEDLNLIPKMTLRHETIEYIPTSHRMMPVYGTLWENAKSYRETKVVPQNSAPLWIHRLDEESPVDEVDSNNESTLASIFNSFAWH